MVEFLGISPQGELDIISLSRTCTTLSSHVANSEVLGILHDLVRSGCTKLVILMIKHFPEHLQLTRQGWLPLHEAARYQGNNTPLLRLLVSAYPDAVRLKTPRGSLPLHLLVSCHGDNIDAVSLILEAFPQAAFMRSEDSQDDGRESPLGWKSGNPEGWYPLHYAVRFFGNNVNMIKLLLKVNPFAVLEKCSGWLPGHLALRYYPNNIELLSLLLDTYPGCLCEPLVNGDHVLWLWVDVGGNPHEIRELLVECAVRCDHPKLTETLNSVFEETDPNTNSGD